MLFRKPLEAPTDPEEFRQAFGPLLFPGGVAGHAPEEVAARTREISPLRLVKGRPSLPFFLIHGDADPVVPLHHSQRLAKAIETAGGDVKVLVKPGGGHPWLTLAEEVQVLGEWFQQRLGGTATGSGGTGAVPSAGAPEKPVAPADTAR
jgi:acetyl esterase/lipase